VGSVTRLYDFDLWRQWKKMKSRGWLMLAVTVFAAACSTSKPVTGVSSEASPVPVREPDKTVTYIGNYRSGVFHRPECTDLPKIENQITFTNRADAIAAGFRPCKLCKP
jgi:Metal binding domain of Ada